MNRMLSVSVVALLAGSAVGLAQNSAFPGCTPKADLPQAVMDYFSKHNQPLPPAWCVGPIVENPNVPEDGAPVEEAAPEEVIPPPEEGAPEVPQTEETYNEQPPVLEQAPQQEGAYEQAPAPGEETYDAAEEVPAERPPVAEYPEGPPPLVDVGPAGVEVNVPGIIQFRWERRHARKEARWIRKGLRRGYTFPQPYPEQGYAK